MGTHVHPWLIHVNVWQNQYSIVKQNKIKIKIKKKRKLWYIYTMEYYAAIKKNTFESVLMRWMKLARLYRVKKARKKNTNTVILMHIYGI